MGVTLPGRKPSQGAADARHRARRRTAVLQVPDNAADGVPCEGLPRVYIIGATLLALFLGAMDALVLSTAMPTIVADLGGLHLYAWAYSSYMLARAVALPIFGKLADRFDTRRLFMTAIGIFVCFSALAGMAESMVFLIAMRAFQGIGAGGNFALVYIVLTEIAPAGKRGLYLSWASFVWGLASVLGPALGGFTVTYLSWRWIFFVNIPLGALAGLGIVLFYTESRVKTRKAGIDFAGALTLTGCVLALLLIFMLGGRAYGWMSAQILLLTGIFAATGLLFIRTERRAQDPILPLPFFSIRGFRDGNIAVFLSSFAIFALFAYAPLFIQGALRRSPIAVAWAMLVLSAGWSLGAVLVGTFVHRIGRKNAAVIGAGLLLAGCAGCLTFTVQTSMCVIYGWFTVVGAGMGFVGVATMLKVQNTVSPADLGVATSSNQFARSLGGTIGVGICGGILTRQLTRAIDRLSASDLSAGMTADQMALMQTHMENLFDPAIIAQFSETVQASLQEAVSGGIFVSFVVVFFAALLCLTTCAMLPKDRKVPEQS